MKKRSGSIIAMDIGGTNLRTALVKNYEIVSHIKNSTPQSKNLFLKELVNAISVLMTKDVEGIGIASPGPLKNGVIMNPENIPLKNFNLKEFIHQKFKKRVEIENDAKCVALAEYNLGVQKENFFVLTLGTGIGGGVIMNGKLFNKEDIGGELGQIYLTKDKSLEYLASGKTIRRLSKEEFGKELNLSELIKINSKGSRKILHIITEGLGQGIGSLINIFNPEVVVLSGGLSKTGDRFLSMVRNSAKRYIYLPRNYNIVLSKLKEPGILGAALLFEED